MVTLTASDVATFDMVAENNNMHVRDFPRWGYEGNTIALVGEQSDFQRFLKDLTRDTEAVDLLEQMGDWTCEGIALSTVWYWRKASLDDYAAELLDKIQDQRGN
jgi:hypothetical protein